MLKEEKIIINSTKCPVCDNYLDIMNINTEARSCSICGYSEVTLPHIIMNESDDSDSTTVGPMGWICPKCGASVSPWTTCCPCSMKWDVTSDSNSTSTSDTVSHNLEQYIGYSRKDKLGYE